MRGSERLVQFRIRRNTAAAFPRSKHVTFMSKIVITVGDYLAENVIDKINVCLQ